MAERRMFTKAVTSSDSFLDMPLSTQALYFHLGMQADDDGFLNSPKMIMRMINASEGDMRTLIEKGFIMTFETGIIVIRHWKQHNYIPKDRYTPTQFSEERNKLMITDGVYNMDTVCIQDVSNSDTQVRIGKDSIGKDNIDKKDGKPSTTRHQYGEYNHVLLTDAQYDKLIADYGESKTLEFIKKVDEYVQMTGRKYKDFNLTIRKFINSDSLKSSPPLSTSSAPAAPEWWENLRR